MDAALSFDDAAAWDAWLDDHHDQPGGVWLRVRKKNSAKTAITVAEAGDVAICYGWIDSIRKSLDEDFFLQKYSPRKPNGTWSRVNVDRVAALTEAGRMRPPGLAEVAAAQADGRWDAAYASQKEAIVPPDLEAALAAHPAARTAFDKRGKTDRYLAMLPILKARTPDARAARLGKLIAELDGQ